ncbi:DUF502 domain-containing protein [Candidatus Margulisiibacteriota bacterium]
MENPIKRFLVALRNYFFTGLFFIMPAAATIWIFYYLLKFLDEFTILNIFVDAPIPGLGILTTFVIVSVIGMIAQLFFIRKIMSFFEKIILKAPLVSNIYIAIKQIVDAIGAKDKKGAFRRVVIVEYPRPGMYALCFLTREDNSFVIQNSEKSLPQNLASVFIPTSPNPTSGYYLMLPADQIIRTNISVENGVKMIISSGVFLPPHKAEEIKA